MQTEVVESKKSHKIMNNDGSYITMILLDRNELEIIIVGGIREWLRLNQEMCWQFLTYTWIFQICRIRAFW